jgi:hypothetical protein
VVGDEERRPFIETVARLPQLQPAELGALNLALLPKKLSCPVRDERGIF